MESVPTVAIRNLRFGWPKQPSLLCVEAFDIAAGEMVLLQGPSGCGKTTLLGLIAGVIAARPAGVRVLGHELASLGARSSTWGADGRDLSAIQSASISFGNG
jgi:putative ABC transport system ATP-binding protein